MQGKDKFPLIPMSYYSHAKGVLAFAPLAGGQAAAPCSPLVQWR
jgi:hypothetical protein